MNSSINSTILVQFFDELQALQKNITGNFLQDNKTSYFMQNWPGI